MSYPDTLWGVGAPRFILSANPSYGRGVRTLAGSETQIIDMPSLVVSSPEPLFTPERHDGGAPQVTLSNGRVIDRIDGYRLSVTLQWANLSLANAQKLVKVFNWRANGGVIELQPRVDNRNRFRVLPVGIEISHPEGAYITHQASISLIGTELLKSIPANSADPTLSEMYPLLEF